jgi:hypothetical protein
LAEEIVKPGIEAVVMFRNVQRRIRAMIKQEPYLGFNAMGDVYLALSAGAQVPARLSDAGEAWAAIRDTASIPILEAFLIRFNETFYAELARHRIGELRKQQATLATAATTVTEPIRSDLKGIEIPPLKGFNADPAKTDTALQKTPLWRILKREFPDWYAERLKEVQALVTQNKDEAAIAKQMGHALVTLRRQLTDRRSRPTCRA